MIIVMPPGSGKTYYHSLRRGLDVETLLITVAGPAIIGHTLYLGWSKDKSRSPDAPRYAALTHAMVRGVLARFPGSLDDTANDDGPATTTDTPNPGPVDLLINYWDLPPDIKYSQCHLRAPSDETLRLGNSQRSGDQDNLPGMLRSRDNILESRGEFSSIKVDMTRDQLEKESKSWRAPVTGLLTLQDVEFMRQHMWKDPEILEVWGTEEAAVLAHVASSTVSADMWHRPDPVLRTPSMLKTLSTHVGAEEGND